MDKPLLDNLFNYNEETGRVTWKTARSPRVKVGGTVGYKTPYGYLQVRLEGKLWMLHRLIWLKMTGALPKGEIDHINGIRDSNEWSNLRDVSKYTNMQNRKRADKDSRTGILGVCFDKQHGKWRAQLRMDGTKILNKLFNTAEEAGNAYTLAKENYYHFRSGHC